MVDTGSFPGLALLMTFSYSGYRLIKRFVPLDPFQSLTFETGILTLSFTQCITSTIQLLLGIFVLGEQVPAHRFVSFGVTWAVPAVTRTVRHVGRVIQEPWYFNDLGLRHAGRARSV